MPFFKNKRKKENKKQNNTSSDLKKVDKKIKKKRKIGFRHKKEEKQPVEKQVENKDEEQDSEVIAEITPVYEEQIKKEKSDQKKLFSSKKEKKIIKRDMKGQPVFLEDTGEKLGIVFDTIIDEEKNIVGYKIKDEKSDTVLSFPLDNFEQAKEGLIFIPGWYTNALKIIEKLEFKDKISPELTALLSDDTVTNEELYDVFVKHDNDMVKYIDDAKSLKEMLNSRLNALEKQRAALKDDLMDLTEKRLIKDIDRKEFSEDVMKHRRKVNILDLNINKCKNLIKRLEQTSFGVLEKNDFITNNKTSFDIDKNRLERIEGYKSNESEPFKKKYYTLKEKYNDLEDEYRELKSAVDELIKKERY